VFGRTNPDSDAYIAHMFNVNVFGQMHVTQAILPRFRAQGSGTIAFTCSSSGWAPFPFMTHYGASKAALTAYAESLNKEVRPFGIKVVTFESGGFPTSLGQPRDGGETTFATNAQKSDTGYEKGFMEVAGMFASDPMAFMPGDLNRVGPTIVDVVKGEGVAEGKKWAVHVVMGSDAYLSVKQKCEEELQLLEGWKDVSVQTDRADHPHVMPARYMEFVSILN
jgi:NAD(P)-dependent dehydrogenase (short-subunit alcohol dehydrogenase family)